MKEGGGGGEGRNFLPSFLPHSLPALLLTPLFSRSLTLVPRSFLLNRTETLATQAKAKVESDSAKLISDDSSSDATEMDSKN